MRRKHMSLTIVRGQHHLITIEARIKLGLRHRATLFQRIIKPSLGEKTISYNIAQRQRRSQKHFGTTITFLDLDII